MSAIGEVRGPDIKPAEATTSAATAINDEATKRPTVAPVAMEAPDTMLMSRPNTATLPLPPEAPQPMSPDNGRAVAKAMHMLITVQVKTTQVLVLTELKPAEAHSAKQHDYRRQHRSTGRDVTLPVADDDETQASPARKRRHGAPSDERETAEEEAEGDILELLELLKSPEPMAPATLARVRQFLESGAAALVTDAPTRFRVPFRI